MQETPTLLIAVLAGLLSFLSPCVLPLVPAYIGYLSGTAMATARAGRPAADGTAAMSVATARWIVMAHAFLFVLGFTFVFVVVIGGLAGALSELLRTNKLLVAQVMGLLLVVFGFHMLGVINIPFLNYTRRLGDQVKPQANLGYLRSLLIGVGFGAGWTPCIGPTLGAIFTLALNGQEGQAFPLFLAYSLGLGIPFLLAGLAMGQISTALKKITRRMYSLKLGNWTVIDQVNVVSLVSGLLLIAMGLLVFTGSLTRLAPAINFFNL